MEIGLRLKELREEKNFSQGDIEKRTGMLRAYVSRVENGHTVPSVETLEKWARALEMPLYQVMYDGDEPPKPRKLVHEQTDQNLWGKLRSMNEVQLIQFGKDARKRFLMVKKELELAKRVAGASPATASFSNKLAIQPEPTSKYL